MFSFAYCIASSETRLPPSTSVVSHDNVLWVLGHNHGRRTQLQLHYARETGKAFHALASSPFCFVSFLSMSSCFLGLCLIDFVSLRSTIVQGSALSATVEFGVQLLSLEIVHIYHA